MHMTEQAAKKFCSAVFQRAGLDPAGAGIFAESLVESEMRGVVSHGITRLKAYADKIRRGEISARGRPVIRRDHPSAILVDGDNAPGVIAARQAMEWCVERAARSGACFAALNNTSHYAAGWFFARYASRRGMIGLAICNSNPLMVAHGGAVPMLGTNPISIAVPAGRNPDLVLDMATSLVAKGKIDLYAKLGQALPIGWIVDRDGMPSTDPADLKGGAMLPFGGPKGYGLALLIDVVCSCLSGAKNGRQITSVFSSDDPDGYRNIGVFVGAIDIGTFVAIETFKERVDGIFEEFKRSPAAKGVREVMLPGEIESRAFERSRTDGVDLSAAVVAELVAVAADYGVPNPFPA
ncbi:MAG: Ldh family oxidoreductase [Planctomycetes bacterium]|nr:Ldh family oxidoreductase [Planctomycetota bacterium]